MTTSRPLGLPRAFARVLLSSLLALTALVLCEPRSFAAPPASASAQTPAPAPTPTPAPAPAAIVHPDSAGLDRATPRRAYDGFLRAARQGDYARAADYLDLRGVPAASRPIEGPKLAARLAYVLSHRPAVDLAKISDAPEGDPHATTPGSMVVDTIYVDEEPVPISLTRVRFNDGFDRWIVSRTTVSMVAELDAAFGPKKLAFAVPAVLEQPIVLGNAPWQWIGLAAGAIAGFLVAWLVTAILAWILRFVARRTKTKADDALVAAMRRPARLLLAACLFQLVLEPLQLTVSADLAATRFAYTLIVIAVARVVTGALSVLGIWLEERASGGAHDDMRTRGIRTQVSLFQRVATVVTIFVASCVILIQFEFVRNVGVSILAAGGLVSVVLGFAAQKSLSGIIAGIQLSIAQPIRIGDAVSVEGEYGEVQEISLTFVVVKLWDRRRMVVPITYFLEKPFVNWTRGSFDLLGAVTLNVDYATPVALVRDALAEICASDPLWDRDTCSLQVTDCDGTTMTLRALVSAVDAGKNSDLRCNVRERLIEFLLSLEGGRFLPRARHVVQAAA